jgi:hypothetical protein
MSRNDAQYKNKIEEQIEAIRIEGITNMLDSHTVQRLAFDHDFYELVDFIETNRKAYAHFIFTGELVLPGEDDQDRR